MVLWVGGVTPTPSPGGGVFLLEGTRSSFARFPPWRVCSNATLTFDFKAARPDGLLLYTDDGGATDYLELKLVQGGAQLRWRVAGTAPRQTSVSSDLADAHWHRLSVTRDGGRVTLAVDASTGDVVSNDTDFGDASHNSPVFIGGIPPKYSFRLDMLAQPTALFEQRYAGAVRRVVYGGCGRESRQQSMVDSQGVRRTHNDTCRPVSPCRHGGVCVSVDRGPWCDCRGTGYEGKHCEKGTSLYLSFYIRIRLQHN